MNQNIKKMQSLGVYFGENNIVKASWILENKHWFKYAKIISFLRKYQVKKMDWDLINFLYRVDINIRRIIDEFLKGYEETIETRIMSISEEEKWFLEGDKDIFSNITFLNWRSLDKTTRNKKNKTKSFFKDAILGIKQKLERNNPNIRWLNIIEEMNFGQKIALFQIINDKNAYKIIQNKDTECNLNNNKRLPEAYLSLNRKKYENELDKMRILRNIISHVNILFTGKQLIYNNTIFDLIKSLEFLMGDKVISNLKKKIADYKNNCINLNKNNACIYNVNSRLIEKIFLFVLKEMFNE